MTHLGIMTGGEHLVAGTAAKLVQVRQKTAEREELARALLAAFRRHPHVNNVMTHISHGQWDRVEEALRAILDPTAAAGTLSPLAINIVELIAAEQGVTGRILSLFMKELLARLLPPQEAACVQAHISGVFEASASERPSAAHARKAGANHGRRL
ncbi:hypothetical protein [Chelativorans sp. AA-79]|uniref:hypothetical protein n=1 Tax=Chelativorans sp. AA-79 TaxID=3028735 RepID=UPI0023F9F05B|nr:hypothetical protein [Chelativorans sp. AA-79]WEX08597.1 hypothetical protein PVE73_21415 [Chelativorans sp. AA-79]